MMGQESSLQRHPKARRRWAALFLCQGQHQLVYDSFIHSKGARRVF